jgi:hypothetical protein
MRCEKGLLRDPGSPPERPIQHRRHLRGVGGAGRGKVAQHGQQRPDPPDRQVPVADTPLAAAAQGTGGEPYRVGLVADPAHCHLAELDPDGGPVLQAGVELRARAGRPAELAHRAGRAARLEERERLAEQRGPLPPGVVADRPVPRAAGAGHVPGALEKR